MLLFSALVGVVVLLLGLREFIRFRGRQMEKAISTHRLVETLADPREAAAILLVQIAAYGDGQVTVEQKERITALMSGQFGSDEEEAEGLFSFGRMAIGQIGDAFDSLGRLLRPIRASLTLDEMKEFVWMMSAVADTHERPVPEARRLIDETRHALHVDLPASLKD
ncbi:MAG: hypothetical protein AAGA69_02100 [Pseudomonadota bacterium]